MTTLTTMALLLLNVRVIMIIMIILAVAVLLYLLYFTAFFTRREARLREEALKAKKEELRQQLHKEGLNDLDIDKAMADVTKAYEDVKKIVEEMKTQTKNTNKPKSTEHGTTQNPE
jgi:Tfp pilus assembly protein PilO